MNIKLTNSKLFAIIDEDDYLLIAAYDWWLRKDEFRNYVQTKIGRDSICIHQLILPAKQGFIIDHKDHNGLNNQRNNLRYATQEQNSFNRRMRLDNSSGYKGVSWAETSKKWRVQLQAGGTKRNGGLHNTKEEAALAYNKLAIRYFGEYATLNILK